MVIEVFVGLLLFGLALATVFAALAGLLGVLGGLYFVRCKRCGRLGVTKSTEPVAACTYCRHVSLAHPLYALSHVHVNVPHFKSSS